MPSKNKKRWITVAIIVTVAAVLIGVVAGTYNGMVKRLGAVEGKQADVQVQLQRRADLIPNFVNTVKGYSDYEQSTLLAVTEARAAVSKAATPGDQAAAGAQLDGAIDVWVNAITEAYPDLKANEQYRALQDELAGTENRIAVARKDYNEAAREYNVSIRKFPRSLFAGLFGFDKVELFQADSGAADVPEVSF